MTTRRRAERAAAAKAQAPPVFDWRDPKYGVGTPGPDNPVTIATVHEARRRAHEALEAWQREHRPPPARLSGLEDQDPNDPGRLLT